MKTKVVAVLLFIAVFSLPEFVSPKTLRDKTDAVNERKSITKFSSRCPPGLWCGKRKRTEPNNSPQESLDQQTRRAESPQAKCPLGLWCGKKREINEVKSIENPQPKTSDERRLITRFASQCPPGLWCGKKRGIVEDRSITMSNPDNRRSMVKFASQCPPGLWCGKKRGINSASEDVDESSLRDVFRRAQSRCPPGLWCGKKRGLNDGHSISESIGNSIERFENQNTAFGTKDEEKELSDEEMNSALEKLFRRASTKCPPGLWCGRKREADGLDEVDLPRQRSLKARSQASCPPGLWCGK